MDPSLQDALRRQIAALEAELSRLGGLDGEHRRHVRAAEEALEQAWEALADALAPSLDEDALARCARLLRMPDFEANALQAEVQRRHAELERRLGELESDPRLKDAPLMRADLEARAREANDHVQALRKSVRELSVDEDFMLFVEDAHNTSWWTFSYHRNRAAGERAAERYGKRRGVADAEGLLKKYREERDALATLEADLRKLRHDHDSLADLEREHAETRASMSTVAEDVLEEARDRILLLARGLEEMTLLERAEEHGEDTTLTFSARRISGAAARRRYLDAMHAHWIERTRGDILTRLDDNRVALAHGGGTRRGAGRTASEVDAYTARVLRELAEPQQQYRAIVTRLITFERWDACDPLGGELWWDVFVGGSHDGSFIDEVTWARTMRRGARHRRAKDARSTWARNADAAEDSLAETWAAMQAAKARGDDGDDDGDDDGEDAPEASAPAPVDLGDD
jgi:hypothetical protein